LRTFKSENEKLLYIENKKRIIMKR